MINRNGFFCELEGREGDRGRDPIATHLTIYSNARSYTLSTLICN